MAKLLKLRRGTTSQHSSFTGAEGEVTVDTDKETLVVNDGSTAGGHPLAKENMTNVSSASIAGRFADDAINPSKIAGGTLGTDVKVADANINGNLTIENADVTNTAAIAGTKIAPNFGSQNIVTTGTLSCDTIASNDITISDQQPRLNFVDNSGSPNNPDYLFQVDGGSFLLHDSTNAADRFSIAADGTLRSHNNHDFSAGIDVTGNITVSGTVDGVDVAALKTSKDSLSTTNGTILGSAVLANGVTATTQSAGDNSTKVATTAYTDTAITNLVDSSPGALNTLNELAAAINDDASFSTTVNNNIATKMPLSGGEFTGNVTCENIVPDSDSSRNLGSNSVRFANVYADNFYGSGANLTGAFLSGMIMMYNSSSAPSGWNLCNGSNGTPDLRDRFIVGAGNSYSHGATGGSVTATDTANINVSVSGSTSGGGSYSFNAGIFRAAGHTVAASGHQHSFSGSGSGSDTISIDTRSPYYALTFIMKS